MIYLRARFRRVRESGFTLVELLVYSALMGLVLLLVFGMLSSSLLSEGTVRGATQAANAGQLAAQSVGTGVRNASAIWHSPEGAVPEILIVRTASMGPTETWRCQAWSYSGGEIRTTTSVLAIDAAMYGSWTLLGEGMQLVSGTQIFQMDARGVTLNVDVSTGDGHDPVRMKTTATSRQPKPVIGPEVSAPCF